jgi:hypothetical protein
VSAKWGERGTELDHSSVHLESEKGLFSTESPTDQRFPDSVRDEIVVN